MKSAVLMTSFIFGEWPPPTHRSVSFVVRLAGVEDGICLHRADFCFKFADPSRMGVVWAGDFWVILKKPTHCDGRN